MPNPIEMQLERVSKTEAVNVLNNTEIHAPTEGKFALDPQLVKESGLAPKHRCSVGKLQFYLSQPFWHGKDRMCVSAFVGLNERETVMR